MAEAGAGTAFPQQRASHCQWHIQAAGSGMQELVGKGPWRHQRSLSYSSSPDFAPNHSSQLCRIGAQHTSTRRETDCQPYNPKDAKFDFPIYLSLADKLGVVELVTWDKDIISKDYLASANSLCLSRISSH